MGVLYSFWQADDEQEAQEFIRGLIELDSLPSPDFKPGRIPTIHELRQIIDQLEGYKTDFNITEHRWQLAVEAPDGYGVTLNGDWPEDLIGDQNAPASFYWKGGLDVMLPVAQKLANLCGTVSMMRDYDLSFTFFFPDQSK